MNMRHAMLTSTVLAALMTTISAADDRDQPITPPLLDYDPNTIKDCTAWYDNYGTEEWDTCEEIRSLFTVSPADFSRWNPTISEDCKGWKSLKSYCVQVRSEWTTTYAFPSATSTEIDEDDMTVPTASETAPYGIPTWMPIGCFINNDTEAQTMEKRMTPEGGDENLTVSRCQALCFKDDNNPFAAGVSDGHTCWCGDYVAADTVSDNECDIPCAGNSSETCGGRDLIFAYKAEFDMSNPDVVASSVTSGDGTSSSAEGVFPTDAGDEEGTDADSAASTTAGA